MAGCIFRKVRSNKMELVQLVKDVPQMSPSVKCEAYLTGEIFSCFGRQISEH